MFRFPLYFSSIRTNTCLKKSFQRAMRQLDGVIELIVVGGLALIFKS